MQGDPHVGEAGAERHSAMMMLPFLAFFWWLGKREGGLGERGVGGHRAGLSFFYDLPRKFLGFGFLFFGYLIGTTEGFGLQGDLWTTLVKKSCVCVWPPPFLLWRKERMKLSSNG